MSAAIVVNDDYHPVGCWTQPRHERCALVFAQRRAETQAAHAAAQARRFRAANRPGPLDPAVVAQAREQLIDPHKPGNGKPKRNVQRGEDSPRAKLTNQQIAEIRASYRKHPTHPRLGNGPELALRYGVTRQTIHLIVTGQRRFAA